MEKFQFSMYGIEYSESGEDRIYMAVVDREPAHRGGLVDITTCIARNKKEAVRMIEKRGGIVAEIFELRTVFEVLTEDDNNSDKLKPRPIDPWLIGDDIIV